MSVGRCDSRRQLEVGLETAPGDVCVAEVFEVSCLLLIFMMSKLSTVCGEKKMCMSFKN